MATIWNFKTLITKDPQICVLWIDGNSATLVFVFNIKLLLIHAVNLSTNCQIDFEGIITIDCSKSTLVFGFGGSYNGLVDCARNNQKWSPGVRDDFPSTFKLDFTNLDAVNAKLPVLCIA